MRHAFFVYLMLLFLSPAVYAAVDINTANQAELETLKGIGPAKAQAIIEYRKKSGGFKTVEELDQVPGIGQATMDSLKKEITVAGKKTAPADTVKNAAEKKKP